MSIVRCSCSRCVLAKFLPTIPRKDRYNKKLEKFHVVFEEGDESVSELEEVERQEQDEACTTYKVKTCIDSLARLNS